MFAITDTRKGLCYSDIRNGQCYNPSTQPVTRSTCCCMVDGSDPVRVGWGQPCAPCPSVDSEEFRQLCPHGPGMTSSGSGA
jgi:fibrillin 2/3